MTSLQNALPLIQRASRRSFLRRGVIAAAVAGASVAAVAPSSRASAAARATGGAGAFPGQFDVQDFGALGTGKADDTSSFARAIAAAAKVRGCVVVPGGTYLIDSLTVPSLVKIQGLGADISRYGAATSGGVDLRHAAGSTSPLMVLDGPGITLENIGFQGNGSNAPLLRVDNGFESRLSRIQLSGVNGTALHVERVNNNLWTDLFVNGCGSDEASAVVVKSPKTGTNTNTFTCINLTIEGSPGSALDLGFGDTPDFFVEFVRLVALHVEGLQTAPEPGSLIRIGNVRQVEFVSPFVYGGPGPLIEHRQTAGRAIPLMGGVRLLGGCLLGSDPAKAPAAASLVHLVRGDDFALVGTRLGRFAEAGVRVDASYGARFVVDATSTIVADGASRSVDDARDVPVP